MGGGGWSSAECEEILRYLEEQARASAGRPDAGPRLAYFSREAWYVADAAADADKPAAVAAALRIDEMAAVARGRGPGHDARRRRDALSAGAARGASRAACGRG